MFVNNLVLFYQDCFCKNEPEVKLIIVKPKSFRVSKVLSEIYQIVLVGTFNFRGKILPRHRYRWCRKV